MLDGKLTGRNWLLLPTPLVKLQLEIKVLMADLNALLNPNQLGTALEQYTDIEQYALDQVCLFCYFCYSISFVFFRLHYIRKICGIFLRSYGIKDHE